MKKIYLIGSLKNWKIIEIGKILKKEFPNVEIFNDWLSPGPDADDFWRDFEKQRGSTYKEALKNHAATHVFEFDKHHIDDSDVVIMCMPCGKSGHLELGYALGKGKSGYILFDEEPERWDVMYQFADDIFFNLEDLITCLKK